MKQRIFLWAIIVGLWNSAAPKSAAQMYSGQRLALKVPAAKNLYVTGGEVFLDATVQGDLTGVSGKMIVNQPVSSDITFAGGELFIHSTVGGDVRIIGGRVVISADVEGDLIITGGEIFVPQDVTIAGDVHLIGGDVNFQGVTKGEARITGGKITYGGTVEGELTIKGGNVNFSGTARGASKLAASELQLGSAARFYSDVAYWTDNRNLDFTGHLENGATANFDPSLKFITRMDEKWVQRTVIGFAVFRLLSAALIITLLVSFFGRFFDQNTGHLRESLGKYAANGAVFLFGVPLLAMLAFFTIIGIPLGFIMLGGYATTIMMAGSLTAVVAAYELEKYLQRDWSRGTMIAVSIALFATLRLVGLLSFPGKLLVLLATLLALGAVIQWLRQGWRQPDETPNDNASASSDSDIV